MKWILRVLLYLLMLLANSVPNSPLYLKIAPFGTIFLKLKTFVASIQHANVFTLRECLYFMQKIGLQIDFGMV